MPGRLRQVALAVATVTSFVAAPAPAAAQNTVIQEKDQVVYKKKSIVDFSDVTISGELTRPEGSYILNRKRATFKLLIRVRETFHPEMMRSVDHL